MNKVLFGIAIFMGPTLAQAAQFKPVIVSALEFGGDDLVDVTYTDGTTSNVEAGRGILLGGGVCIDLLEAQTHTVELQATMALKFTSSKQATNGEADWYRFPLEVLAFYRNTENNFRLGGGLNYQLANSLSGTEDASAISLKFNNALAAVFAGDYFFGDRKNFSVGLRYTLVHYTPQIAPDASVSGNSFGVSFNYFWF